jgi:chromosome segregation ATPase
MFKKLLIAALAVFVGLSLLWGTRAGSYMRLNWTKAQDWAQAQVPPETEIERLRMELTRLGKEDDRYFDQVAKQKLSVAKLAKKVAADKTALTRMEGEIRSMREALAEDAEFIVFNGSRYPRKDVQEQVREDVRQFLADEEAVKADEDHLKELQKTLSLNEQKLKELGLARKKMSAKISTLEKELAQERRIQSQNQLTVDDSNYNRLNKEIDDLEGRIDVMKTKRELRGQSVRGPVRAAEEAKEEQNRLDKQAEARFGPLEPARKVVGK